MFFVKRKQFAEFLAGRRKCNFPFFRDKKFVFYRFIRIELYILFLRFEENYAKIRCWSKNFYTFYHYMVLRRKENYAKTCWKYGKYLSSLILVILTLTLRLRTRNYITMNGIKKISKKWNSLLSIWVWNVQKASQNWTCWKSFLVLWFWWSTKGWWILSYPIPSYPREISGK